MAKDTKERILMTALDMFSKKGYEGTNIREFPVCLVPKDIRTHRIPWRKMT